MVLMATVVYIAIFFSPKDLVYKTVKLVPIYATICFLKEILRAKKVYKGLAEGRDHMPHGGSLFFIPVLIATLKGKLAKWRQIHVVVFKYKVQILVLQSPVIVLS